MSTPYTINGDLDLSHLIGALSLHDHSTSNLSDIPTSESPPSTHQTYAPTSAYPPDPTGTPPTNSAPIYGCAYLQSILTHLDNISTTTGVYLEIIFTHREIQLAYPAAHIECARGFSDLASAIERRAWRCDRDGDGEAAAAYRNEAWNIAANGSYSRSRIDGNHSGRFAAGDPDSGPVGCIMMPVY